MNDMNHMNYLDAVAASDVAELRRKEATYRGSWKAAGGRSAWFMLLRKMDRLRVIMAKPDDIQGQHSDQMWQGFKDGEATPGQIRYLAACYCADNIFAMIRDDPSGADGSALAEIRDLRRYLMLVETEMISRGVVLSIGNTMLNEHVHMGSGGGGGVSGDLAPKTVTVRPGTPEDGGHHSNGSGEAHPVYPSGGGAGAPIEGGRDGNTPPLRRLVPRMPERLEDGVDKLPDGEYYIPVVSQWTPYGEKLPNLDKKQYLIVNRRMYGDHTITKILHLPRLQVEMNNKEYELERPWYHGLYEWHSSPSKWIMKKEYVEHWGRQP